MVDYSIAAIPTVYHGRRYRSRLEARWAAFFDLLEWNAEYEPFDLGTWSPDFLLPEWNVWVEIKPAADLVGTVWDKCWRAAKRVGASSPGGLLLTEQPKTNAGNGLLGRMFGIGCYAAFDSLGAPRPAWIDHVGWTELDNGEQHHLYDLAAWYNGPRHLSHWGDEIEGPRDPYDLEKRWQEAANLVQWQPGAQP